MVLHHVLGKFGFAMLHLHLFPQQQDNVAALTMAIKTGQVHNLSLAVSVLHFFPSSSRCCQLAWASPKMWKHLAWFGRTVEDSRMLFQKANAPFTPILGKSKFTQRRKHRWFKTHKSLNRSFWNLMNQHKLPLYKGMCDQLLIFLNQQSDFPTPPKAAKQKRTCPFMIAQLQWTNFIYGNLFSNIEISRVHVELANHTHKDNFRVHTMCWPPIAVLQKM